MSEESKPADVVGAASSRSDAHVPVFLRAVMDVFAKGAASAFVTGATGDEGDDSRTDNRADWKRERDAALIVPPSEARWMFDGTFGRGGHSRAMIAAYPSAREIAFDWDEEAIRFGATSFASEISNGKLQLVRANFQDFAEERAKFPDVRFDRMLLDLGVSSPQLDQAHRGFSFSKEGPLDMRMDQRLTTTAADLVNTLEEQDLARLFIEYGEVQKPYRVVRAIVNDRTAKKPWSTTQELSSLIERVDGWHKKGSHPATRYFMALRLKVNEELDGLSRALPSLIESLNEGGILAIITFHSLEDRIVKHIFKEHLNVGRLINKKVIKPDDEELRQNPRARSAKLRAFQKGCV